MLIVVILIVIMLIVVILIVIMLSVVAPPKGHRKVKTWRMDETLIESNWKNILGTGNTIKGKGSVQLTSSLKF